MIRSTLLHLVLALLAAACSSGDGGGRPPQSGSISGTLLFVPAQPLAPIEEVEPNDGVDEPQAIGELAPGGAYSIRGGIGVGEGFDGYAFVARGRVRVEAELRFAPEAGRRVELAAYDPLAMGVVARADAAGKVAFTAGGAFDLVVRGAQGAGAYELTVRATAAPWTIETPGWLGAVAGGDTLRFGAGRYEMTMVEAGDLRIGMRSVSSLRVLALGRDGETAVGPGDSGMDYVVSLEPLQRIAIESSGGTIAVDFTPRSATAPVRFASDRLLAAASERVAFGLATGDALYGRVPSNVKIGDVLVKPLAGQDLADDLARRSLARVDQVGEEVLQVRADLGAIGDEATRARTTVALVRSLAASPRVAYAELNRIRRPLGGPPETTPNDAFFSLQWHYPLIRLPQAWTVAQTAITGPGPTITVAVIDTGRRPHPDLDANTRTDIEYDFITSTSISQDGDGPDPIAFDEGDSEGIGPSSFHGTHVAGTIAAVTNNGVGVAGVGSLPVGNPAASRVRVVHLRVLGKGGGTDADIARSIRYAAGLTNPGLPTLPNGSIQVLNLSLGGPGSNQTVQAAVTAARNRGLVIFAAAGNANSSAPSYPAAYANVVSVAAVDQNSARAPYSNYHASVDLCAPGGDTSVDTNVDGYVDGVLSTLVAESSGNPIYVFYQGTSMACPHAAGLAALMLVVNPVLLPAQIEQKLAETATDLGAPGRDVFHGQGLINALAAVQSALGAGGAQPVLAASPTELNFGATATALQLSLQNLGDGTVDITTYTDDRSWISLVPGGPAAGIDVGSLSVRVNRADPALAADGTYTGSVTVNSANAGSVVVPVTVRVETPVLPNVELFVLAVDFSVNPSVTVAETLVNPALTGLDYILDELSTANGELLPPGTYLLACGSDDDGDFFICGDADVYCGLYPTLNDPALIVLDGPRAGVDFVVAPQGSTTPMFTSQRGWRRLAR
ncbi:MAG: S8 family serine peptidase [Planctomycetes bacterium]|nr:S8 family serine peptidase [Planctomycetota bacterium]